MFQAAKNADKDNHAGGFDVSLLDEFMGLAVDIGAFDHIRCAKGVRTRSPLLGEE